MPISKKDLTSFSSIQSVPVNLVGSWVNELGSVMVIGQVQNSMFNGRYRSAVGANHGPVDGALTGTIAGDSIGFTVNWQPTFASVTAWTGKVLADPNGAPYIYTLWQLAQGIDDPQDLWQSILAGSDIFEKTAP